MTTEMSVREVEVSIEGVQKEDMPKPSKKSKKAKPAWEGVEEYEEEDILYRFSNPVNKRKRKEKKEKREEEKKAKIVNDGKLFAVDQFNTEPTKEELEMWRGFVDEPMPSLDELTRLQEAATTMTTDSIGYVRMEKTTGFFAVMDCLQAMGFCAEWLENKLRRIGWKRNMTGYVPTAVSHSTNEILGATLECYRMAIKQMILFVKHAK